jgi:hypothetical protein
MCAEDCARLNKELEAKALTDAPEATFAEAALIYLRNGGDKRFLTKKDGTPAKLLAELADKRVNEIDDAVMTAAAVKLYPDAEPITVNRQLYTPVITVMGLALCFGDGLFSRDNRRGLVRRYLSDLLGVAYILPIRANRFRSLFGSSAFLPLFNFLNNGFSSPRFKLANWRAFARSASCLSISSATNAFWLAFKWRRERFRETT